MLAGTAADLQWRIAPSQVDDSDDDNDSRNSSDVVVKQMVAFTWQILG